MTARASSGVRKIAGMLVAYVLLAQAAPTSGQPNDFPNPRNTVKAGDCMNLPAPAQPAPMRKCGGTGGAPLQNCYASAENVCINYNGTNKVGTIVYQAWVITTKIRYTTCNDVTGTDASENCFYCLYNQKTGQGAVCAVGTLWSAPCGTPRPTQMFLGYFYSVPVSNDGDKQCTGT